jgi:hypothetical protein
MFIIIPTNTHRRSLQLILKFAIVYINYFYFLGFGECYVMFILALDVTIW